ncbi:peroxiredoxin [Abyssisolibacter fermentans]|uniref:peroxiredoxin n=1 Tax=Abyssisolibacter fermentans TaxID=1766203 RepID=UPI0009EBFABB|nr:peroxiredoxin [Abyssisolibacter fermentans]
MQDNCLRIGMKAPDFKAVTTFGNVKLSDYKGKWLVLFSHPGDFTPVCTTEFLAFTQYYSYFKERNTELLGLSIDSNPSHLAWVYNIYENTGVQVPFPIIADRDGSIASLYGMISKDVSETTTVRNVFIIDDKGIIRAILVYPLTNGRNIPEILRLVEALQVSDKTKTVTPANWRKGCPTIIPPPKTYEELLRRKNCPNCIDWYWCYKYI